MDYLIPALFDIKTRVKIIPLECNGKVTAIWKGDTGVMYKVRYFDKAEAREVFFYGDELEEIK